MVVQFTAYSCQSQGQMDDSKRYADLKNTAEQRENFHFHHHISFSCSVAQIGVQPVHQSLYLVPVEKNEKDEK